MAPVGRRSGKRTFRARCRCANRSGLFAAAEYRQQVVAALDRPGIAFIRALRHARARLDAPLGRASVSTLSRDKRVSRANRRPRPCRPPARRVRRFRRAGFAGRAKRAPRRRAANAFALLLGEAAFGPDQDHRGPGPKRLRRRHAAAFVGKIEGARRVPLSRNARSGRRFAISGSCVRPHCSAASIAIASRRSSFTRSAIVRRVITGISRAAPSSVAFSTSQSVCLRFTGAKASQTSGIVSGSRVLALDDERHALLAGLGDARQPFARAAVERQQLRPRASAEARCRDNSPGLHPARPTRLRPAAPARTGAAGSSAARRGSRAWVTPA